MFTWNYLTSFEDAFLLMGCPGTIHLVFSLCRHLPAFGLVLACKATSHCFPSPTEGLTFALARRVSRMATWTLPGQTSQSMFLDKFVTLSLASDGLVSAVCLFLHGKNMWRDMSDSTESLRFLFGQTLLQSLSFVCAKCVVLSQLWMVGDPLPEPRSNLLLVTLCYLLFANSC